MGKTAGTLKLFAVVLCSHELGLHLAFYFFYSDNAFWSTPEPF